MKRNSLKNFIALLLVVCLSVSVLAACGGGGQGTGATEKNEEKTTDSAQTDGKTESTSAEADEKNESTSADTDEKNETTSIDTDDASESAPAETSDATESSPVETSDATESAPAETNDVTESAPAETNDATESTSTEAETETQTEPIKPDWDNLPDVDTNVAYVDRSIGHVDGACVVSTEYNSRNMILGARYEILAYARYYVKTEFTYAENGPLTELYVEVTGSARYRFVFEYDEEGNLISSRFIENGREKDLPVTLEYHANGLVKKVGNDEFMQEFDALGRLVVEDIDETRATVHYTYSGDNRKPDAVKVSSTRSGGNIELTPYYNDDRMVEGVKEDYPDSKYYIDYTFTYTPAQRVAGVEAKAINYEEELYWTVILENGYDDRLNVTSVKNLRTAPDGSVIRKEDSEFEYDEKNRNIYTKFTSYNSDLSINYIDESSYKYDSENRVIWCEDKSYDGEELEYISVETYEYYANGVTKTERDATEYFKEDMREKHDSLTEYHENGQTAKRTDYTYDAEGNITNYYCTEYDDQGRTLRNAYIHPFDPEFGTSMHEEFFDENRRVIKTVETYYSGEGIVIYKDENLRFYDDDGKVTKTESSSYDSDGVLSSKTVVLLDADGKVISENTDYYDESGASNGKNIREYTYYDSGARKESSDISYYANGAKRRSEVWTYDERGNGISCKVHEYAEDGRLIEHSETEVEYDADGNRTKHAYARFLGDGQLLYRETWEFEYSFYDDGSKKSEISTMYDTDNVIRQSEEREYNASGDTVRETRKEFYEDGTLSSLDVYEYDPETGSGKRSYVKYHEDGSVDYEEKEEW